MLPGLPRVTVLGPARISGRDPGGPVARALLAALALAGGSSPRSVAALADDLWGDGAPQHPRAALQSVVSRVRAAAGPDGADIVITAPGGYALGTAAGARRSDLELAHELGTAAERAGGHDERLALAEQAIGLWTGEAGTDLGTAPVASGLVDAALRLRERLERQRCRALLGLGRAGEAASALRALAASRPLDEALHAELMTALDENGETADALTVFAELRGRLRDELGTSPGRAVIDLNARLLRQEESASERVRIGVRDEPAELFGRERDIERVSGLIRDRRVITVLGPGGIGKTRLAHTLAAASNAPVVVAVALAGVRVDGDVVPAIAAALGIAETAPGGVLAENRPRPELRGLLLAALGDRDTLLVLDNCEQVIDGVAEWVAEAVAMLPRLRVLATSRTPLGLAAEQSYPLAPLAVEGEAHETNGPAVRLFLERARAVRPAAELPLDTVARLCLHLDGLPLAIELAAARVRTMTPEQIEERLRDRFALLRGGDRSAPDRHRTLEAVIEWSWDLLDDRSRRVMTALSILPGGFSADTAAGVLASGDAALGAPETDEALDSLVAQSLLIVFDDPTAGGVRFRMLETVREFGIARLRRDDAEHAAWDALRAWARGFALDRAPRVFGPPGSVGPEGFRVIRAEQENLLAALRDALAGRHAEDTVLVFAVLAQLWLVQGAHTELFGIAAEAHDVLAEAPQHDAPADALAVSLFLCAVSMLVTDDPRALRLLARLRMLRRTAGDRLHPLWRSLIDLVSTDMEPASMHPRIERLRRATDPVTRLIGEMLASQFAENDGETRTAMTAAQRAWRLAEELGEAWLAAMAASSAAQLASQSARPAEALEWLERASVRLEAFGAEEELRERGWMRGMALVSLGRPEEARPLFEQLTRSGRVTAESREAAAIGWHGLAEVARAQGDTATAIRAFENGMAEFEQLDQRAVPWQLITMAGLTSAACLDGSLPDETIARWAGRLRSRSLAVQRLRAGAADRPVLGTALVGWAAWAITIPALRDRGVEALALGEVLGARQDYPSLRLDVHRERAAAIAGTATVERACRAARELAPDARMPRALAVLAAPLG